MSFSLVNVFFPPAAIFYYGRSPKKPDAVMGLRHRAFGKIFGGVLLSHTVSRAVPSALKSLTSVFGMGTGVTSSLSPPKKRYKHYVGYNLGIISKKLPLRPYSRSNQLQHLFCGQAARPISTGKLNTLLCVHTRPINLVVYEGSSGSRSCGISNLGVGFPLRCFQRLSFPNVATQLCRWRDNWTTIGSSIPVLSY